MDIINSEVDSLNNLVSDMLDLSKLSNGAIDLDIEPFDLSSSVIKTVEKFQTLAESEGVNLICDCEPELVVYGDERRIVEVIYNFISNALKHYGEDKKVIISAHLINKEKVRVEVKDHGSGIDNEVLPYIWDRYYKNDKKYFRSQTGTGLGLAICKAILELHNVEYGVESQIGEGSTFYFVLNSINIE